MKYQDIKHLLKKGMTVNVITADGCDNDPICLGEQTLVRYVSILGEWATDRGHYIRGQSEIEIVSNPDGSSWVNPKEFKVGDRVKVINPGFSNNHVGDIGIITEVDCMGYYRVIVKGRKAYGNWQHPSGLEKVEEPISGTFDLSKITWVGSIGSTEIETINEPKAQKGIFMNVIDKIKNFKLTKEDRILRENGLEDEDGKMTGLAGEMMSDEMIKERWATRRLEVAKDLLEIKNEELKK